MKKETMKGKNLRIALFGNVFQTKKNVHVRTVLQKLAELGMEVCIEETFARFIQCNLNVDISDCTLLDAADFEADLAVSMGGDGTFLNTAAFVGARPIPILGINTGRLGFLADVSPDMIDEALDAVSAGGYVVEQRSVIAVEKDGEPLRNYPFALNEVAVLKHDNSSLIEIKMCVDGALLTKYMADGLIVCTPTGSTGYSLSVGGPIIVPRSGTFCVSPVASHSLSTRPVILCDDVVVTLEVRSRSHNFLISIDGRSESFPDGTVITLRRAPYTTGVMKIKHKNFFDTLRDKMMWGIDQRI